MDNKESLIKASIQQLLRIANKYSRIEVQPIAVEQGVEITTKEAHTIQAIGEKDRINVTDLARRFGVTRSAASQIATRLVKKGFIRKSQSAHSNKEVELSLTELGWRAFRAHERSHGEDMARLVARLSAYPLNQIATLSVLLEAIDEIMNERLQQC